ncbi:CD3072 family TudS-related putative desulfidase [Salidesulfovibrio onnuriiensis]|uniref:CD3072 family TudS-related putative desulfidase n=1 Tax=Salidesulfovibrio onnuriiensis TaxID=2583823 RepID=UPI0011C84676|nr:CD3072 family TudS-related putative desulfidase [Salidesulfovibrio onnuriiensis]
MNRSRTICVAASCLLNANAKITPYAACPGVNTEVIMPWIEQGAGLLQLPCPETTYLGMLRWGMTREQYDTQGYRDHCRAILRAPLMELRAYAEAGYAIAAVLGVNGSPSCGVETTCEGYCGGEVSEDAAREQRKNLRMVPGRGVFMEVLADMLREHGLDVPLTGMDDA